MFKKLRILIINSCAILYFGRKSIKINCTCQHSCQNVSKIYFVFSFLSFFLLTFTINFKYMWYYFIKLIITSAIIVAISEISKRSSLIGSILASIPLISFLAFIWLYIETKDVGKIAELSTNIFWLVIPSLSFFYYSLIY